MMSPIASHRYTLPLGRSSVFPFFVSDHRNLWHIASTASCYLLFIIFLFVNSTHEQNRYKYWHEWDTTRATIIKIIMAIVTIKYCMNQNWQHKGETWNPFQMIHFYCIRNNFSRFLLSLSPLLLGYFLWAALFNAINLQILPFEGETRTKRNKRTQHLRGLRTVKML